MQEELEVALGARHRRGRGRLRRQSYLTGRRRDLVEDARLHRRVPDDAFADLGAACLELRFDERDDVAPRFEQRGHDRKDRSKRDERYVDRDEVHLLAEGLAREMTRVEMLDDLHARI